MTPKLSGFKLESASALVGFPKRRPQPVWVWAELRRPDVTLMLQWEE